MKWLKGAFPLLVVVLCACSREQAAPAGDHTKKPVVIEVIDDPAQIVSARRADVERRDQRFAELIANPAFIYPFETEDIALLRARQDEAVAALSALRDDEASPAEKRVQAVVALRLLGVPVETPKLAELASHDASAKLALLGRLSDLFPSGEPLPAPIRQLIVAGIDDSDPRILRTAVMTAAQYNVDDAGERILVRLKGQVEQDSDVLLDAAARLRPTRQVIDLLVSRLNETHGPFGAPAALDSLAEAVKITTDIDARRVAVTAIMKYLLAHPDETWIDSSTISAVEAIGQLPPSESTQALADLARNMKWRVARDSAVAELSDLDPELAKRVAQETGAIPDVEPSAAAVDEISTERAVTAKEAADICVKHDIMDRAEAEGVLAKLQQTTTQSTDEGWAAGDSVLGFLSAAERFHAFDVETGTVPNRHDLLIMDFANKSAGRFKPEAVLETYTADAPDAETGQYEVQFIHAGRLYRFQPGDLGDWYDVGAVLAAIERALADAGEKQRFALLELDGQTAGAVFADPVALSNAADELGLALSADPDAARRQGQAFEDQVLQSLQ